MKESIQYSAMKAKRRVRRVRAKLKGTAARPRMSVHFSNRHFSVQFIDDTAGRTLLQVSDRALGAASSHVSARMAREFGKKVAELARGKGIEAVVFDRGGRAYHGRVKAVAEGAREAGLRF